MGIKLNNLLSERKFSLNENDDEVVSIEERREFLKNIKRFNEYSKIVNRTESLREIVEDLNNLIETARRVALAETDEWFDRVSLERDMKSLQDDKKLFEKTALEVTRLQNRLESAYQGIGNTLAKYYDLS